MDGAPGAEDTQLVRELQHTARGLSQRGNADEAVSCLEQAFALLRGGSASSKAELAAAHRELCLMVRDAAVTPLLPGCFFHLNPRPRDMLGRPDRRTALF